jgi:hypothetical protein
MLDPLGKRQTYLEDPPRIVLVVCNASVTHPPLSHHGWIETCIGGWRLATTNKLTNGCISSVLFFHLAVSAAAHE